MGRDETHDAACEWAFRKTFWRSPTPDELRDYKLALDERDRLGLSDALPIFARLRAASTKAPRPKRRRIDGPAEPPPRKRRGRPPRVRQARELLQEQLADGPKPGAEIEAAAEAAEIPKRELLTACDRLDVRTQRGQWWLPVEPT
jgi:hypothetical protein